MVSLLTSALSARVSVDRRAVICMGVYRVE